MKAKLEAYFCRVCDSLRLSDCTIESVSVSQATESRGSCRSAIVSQMQAVSLSTIRWVRAMEELNSSLHNMIILYSPLECLSSQKLTKGMHWLMRAVLKKTSYMLYLYPITREATWGATVSAIRRTLRINRRRQIVIHIIVRSSVRSILGNRWTV